MGFIGVAACLIGPVLVVIVFAVLVLSPDDSLD